MASPVPHSALSDHAPPHPPRWGKVPQGMSATPSKPPPLAATTGDLGDDQSPPSSPSPCGHLPQDLHRRHFGPPRDYPGGHHCRAATRPAPTQGQRSAGQWAGPQARTKPNFGLHGHKDKDEVGGERCGSGGGSRGTGNSTSRKEAPKKGAWLQV